MATAFAEWVRLHRKQQGLSLQQFADRLGVTKDMAFRLEKGSPMNPPSTIVVQAAHVFGRPLVEALEALGYSVPVGNTARLHPSLVNAATALPLHAQQELANALPHLLAIAELMRAPPRRLLRAAEPSPAYRPRRRRKKKDEPSDE